MRTVRLIRGGCISAVLLLGLPLGGFCLFSYLVRLSPPWGFLSVFLFCSWVFFLAWASSWASSWASPCPFGACGLLLPWVLFFFRAFFCPLGFFPGGLWFVVCVGFLEGYFCFPSCLFLCLSCCFLSSFSCFSPRCLLVFFGLSLVVVSSLFCFLCFL